MNFKQIFKKIIIFIIQIEARAVIWKYNPKIVAVTGNVGKTSTKDAIYAVLSASLFVRKSSKSFNSEIGVPLTILGLNNAWNDPVAWFKNILDGLLIIIFPYKYPKWLVIEVGADRPDDIKSITSWLKPDVSVVTRLSDVPVHIEFFKSAEQVRTEKSMLVRATKKSGVVILNDDDKRVSSFRPLALGRVVTYGLSDTADIRGTGFSLVYAGSQSAFPTGISYVAHIDGKEVPIEINGALGRQQIYMSLVALAVATVLGLSPEKAKLALKKYVSPPGRMKILSGINGSCIIDDTYNSAPIAVHEALETMRNIKATGRKIVVLGDMLELGKHTNEEHYKVGVKAYQVADQIYTVGTRARKIIDTAVDMGFDPEKVFSFDDSVSAGEFISRNIDMGDIVLIKGSQGKRMERVVERILSEPDRAPELLVRQEKEWKAKV